MIRKFRREKIRKIQAFTLIELTIAVGIIVLISALSIHSLLRAKVTANEAAAMKSLRTLHTAFASYRVVNPNYPDALKDLAQATPPYIDNALAAGRRQGYDFAIEEVDANTFRLAAIPVTEGVTGNRSFYIDQGGEIITGGGGGVGIADGDSDPAHAAEPVMMAPTGDHGVEDPPGGGGDEQPPQ